jgi:hypothetical protein
MWTKKIWPVLIGLALLLTGPVTAQEEVASRYYHYRSTEMATGLYEEYEVRPRNQAAFFQAGERQGAWAQPHRRPGRTVPGIVCS